MDDTATNNTIGTEEAESSSTAGDNSTTRSTEEQAMGDAPLTEEDSTQAETAPRYVSPGSSVVSDEGDKETIVDKQSTDDTELADDKEFADDKEVAVGEEFADDTVSADIPKSSKKFEDFAFLTAVMQPMKSAGSPSAVEGINPAKTETVQTRNESPVSSTSIDDDDSVQIDKDQTTSLVKSPRRNKVHPLSCTGRQTSVSTTNSVSSSASIEPNKCRLFRKNTSRKFKTVLQNVPCSVVTLILGIGIPVGLMAYTFFGSNSGLEIDKSLQSFSIPNHIGTKRQKAFDGAWSDHRAGYEESDDEQNNVNKRDVSRENIRHIQNRAADSYIDLISWSNPKTSFKIDHNIVERDTSSDPQLPQRSRKQTLQLVFLAIGENDDNIFTEERLQIIHFVEMYIMNKLEFHNFCYKAYWKQPVDPFLKNYGGCAPINSMMTYFFPAIAENGVIYYNGLGPRVADVESTLQFAMSQEQTYWYVDEHMSSSHLKSTFVRSEVQFGTPLKGYSNREDRQNEQDEAYTQFLRSLIQELRKMEFDSVRILYGSSEVYNIEVDEIFWNDITLAAIGVSCILVFMFVLTSFSTWLTIWGLLSILMSFPLALFFHINVIGLKKLGILNGAAAFVIIGIGVDDVFVFVNTFRQAHHVKNNGDRLYYTVITAGKATFFTSFTTAAAFAANIASAIPAVYEFGLFMSLIVCSCWLCVVAIMPAALNLWHRAFARCETKCYCSKGCCCKQTPQRANSNDSDLSILGSSASIDPQDVTLTSSADDPSSDNTLETSLSDENSNGTDGKNPMPKPIVVNEHEIKNFFGSDPGTMDDPLENEKNQRTVKFEGDSVMTHNGTSVGTADVVPVLNLKTEKPVVWQPYMGIQHKTKSTTKDDISSLESQASADKEQPVEGCGLTLKCQRILYEYIAKPIVKFRWVIFGGYFVLLAISIGLVTQLKPASKIPQLFSSDTNLQQLLDLTANFTGNGVSCNYCSGFYKVGFVEPTTTVTTTTTTTTSTTTPTTPILSTQQVELEQTTLKLQNTEADQATGVFDQTTVDIVTEVTTDVLESSTVSTVSSTVSSTLSPSTSRSDFFGGTVAPDNTSTVSIEENTQSNSPESSTTFHYTTTFSTTTKPTSTLSPAISTSTQSTSTMSSAKSTTKTSTTSSTSRLKSSTGPPGNVVTPTKSPSPGSLTKPSNPSSTTSAGQQLTVKPTPTVPDNYNPCDHGECDVEERPNIVLGAAVYVIFGVEGVEENENPTVDVLETDSKVVYDDDFSNVMSLSNLVDPDIGLIKQLCNICSYISNRTDLVRRETSQCLPTRGLPGVVIDMITSIPECGDIPLDGDDSNKIRAVLSIHDTSIKWMAFAFESTLYEGSSSFDAYKVYQEWEDLMTEIHDKMIPDDSPLKSMFQTSPYWQNILMEIVAVGSAIYGLVFSMLICIAAVAIFTGHAILLLIITMTISGVILLVVAIFYIAGWELGAIEAVSLSILVGSSVDYCVHLVEGYLETGNIVEKHESKNRNSTVSADSKSTVIDSKSTNLSDERGTKNTTYSEQEDATCEDFVENDLNGASEDSVENGGTEKLSNSAIRRWRTQAAIGHIGVSILSSALTTIAAAIPLSVTVIKPFSKFGQIVAINTAVSIFYTLTACSAFLAIFAPARFKSSWRSTFIAFGGTVTVVVVIVLGAYTATRLGVVIPGPDGQNLFT